MATRQRMSFENIYTDFEVRLLLQGRPVLVKDDAHGKLLEERLALGRGEAGASAKYDSSLLVRITDEERSFFETLTSELFLADKNERTQEIIRELRVIQKIKNVDRSLYELSTTLMESHEGLLVELSSIITPYGYVHDSQEDYERRKSLDIVVDTYQDDMRLNQKVYAVSHPIAMARAASFLGWYFHFPPDVILVNQLSCLRHDVPELVIERLEKLDLSKMTKEQRNEVNRLLNEANNPEKGFKRADKRIKNYMILHAVEQGMEPDVHLLDLVDVVRYTSVHLTKPMGISWDKNVKRAVKRRTIEAALGRWVASEEKRREFYPLVRTGVCIDKPCDLIYNCTDFDDIRVEGERVFTLKKRLKILGKSVQLFNALSQEYAARNFEGEYSSDALVLLKKAMMYAILPQTRQMLEYVLERGSGEGLSESVIERKIHKLVDYDSQGYNVARKKDGKGRSAHPDDDPDGTLFGLRLLVREKEMNREERKKHAIEEDFNWQSSSEMFSRILAVHRLAELGVIYPYRIIRNF